MTARTFLPEDEEAYHLEHDQVDVFRSLEDEIWTKSVSALVSRYAEVYTELDFSIAWNSDRRNADTQAPNGTTRGAVVLYGGMAMNTAVGINGLAIVLAHEVAHHLDAREKFADGLACESCADYLATAVVMPAVWSGLAFEMAKDGIARLEMYWQRGPDTSRRSTSGCYYPPNAVRVQLLSAGAEGRPYERCMGRLAAARRHERGCS